MTRFLYLSDTHYGLASLRYAQQTAYPKRLPEILTALCAWMEKNGPPDFVLHGGDMIDTFSAEAIREVSELFALPVPVYLCLGNHDLTRPEAVQRWLQYAPKFFPGGTVNYDIVTNDCVLHIAPNQWSPTPYFWEQEKDIHFLPEQKAHLSRAMRSHEDVPHILATHAPARGLPPGQIQGKVSPHSSGEKFEKEVTALLAHCPDPRLVLTGHSHINLHRKEGHTHYAGAASLIEAPFEFKLVEVDHGDIRLSTHSIAEEISFHWEYDSERSFVQGRPRDRGFVSNS
jgi:DNA repair exonuclease SbcCD nuclease subunit